MRPGIGIVGFADIATHTSLRCTSLSPVLLPGRSHPPGTERTPRLLVETINENNIIASYFRHGRTCAGHDLQCSRRFQRSRNSGYHKYGRSLPGNTVAFAAGTYSLAETVALPCSNGTIYTGPNVGAVTQSNLPNAVLTSTVVTSYALSTDSNVTSLTGSQGCISSICDSAAHKAEL